ncbi:hypothetical protein HZH66_014152 [Vespula vulgaris]|uniref:Uncharacterized protein n=1 Tax=Vespula vulgaris TaxID=7454 RepID=A0A834J855_VESVU|nr:hypothetical protein HZH66_014152 [Vespula vulgaris]
MSRHDDYTCPWMFVRRTLEGASPNIEQFNQGKVRWFIEQDVELNLVLTNFDGLPSLARYEKPRARKAEVVRLKVPTTTTTTTTTTKAKGRRANGKRDRVVAPNLNC